MSPKAPVSPEAAWQALREGNDRFVAGTMTHPSQGVDHRREVSVRQHPFAVIFGCSDSRVGAELIFDRGLGDLFVVRTAGHVVDTTVIGSIEYGVDVLGVPLVVVLGHDHCGALQAAIDALTTGKMPGGFVRAVVDRVIPSLVMPGQQDRPSRPDTPPSAAGDVGAGYAETEPGAPSGGHEGAAPVDAALQRQIHIPDDDALRRQHVRATVQMLRTYSLSLENAIAEGRCAVIGVEYDLADGRARLVD
ncbi:carbonic anhydrase [Pseudactinotalea sp. Z1748]|uniref:carbonic anhydrase n=1 Tax=Pseudactinotalea sp. Z1748 TaxID=3413027 RepID=UPI003C7AC8A5